MVGTDDTEIVKVAGTGFFPAVLGFSALESWIQNSAETNPPFRWPFSLPLASTARISHGTSH